MNLTKPERLAAPFDGAFASGTRRLVFEDADPEAGYRFCVREGGIRGTPSLSSADGLG